MIIRVETVAATAKLSGLIKMNNPILKKVNRKSMIIRPSGRSTDFITPSFGYGCLGFNCTYCYMKRHKPIGLDVATNTNEILTEINNHAMFATVDKPNQTHPVFISYDLSCNEDFALHAKHHEWKHIFSFFKEHPIAMGSFATKYVNKNLLTFNPKGKIRIRFSLMPQEWCSILEPNTTSITHRLKAIERFIEAGYDVHVNFSPVIVHKGWLSKYKELFKALDSHVISKEKVKCEVIFLTHNEEKHKYNIKNNLPGEELLWVPQIQESKTSQYGGKNIRYKSSLKKKYIQQFTELHNELISWCTIRYIF
jgi:spore photoproduct lyase